MLIGPEETPRNDGPSMQNRVSLPVIHDRIPIQPLPKNLIQIPAPL